MSTFAVILPAAGGSIRFGGSQSKLIADLDGLPVITRAVLPFVQRSDTGPILIAVPNDPHAAPNRVNDIWNALSRDPQVKNRLGGQISLVPGGPNRAESVRSALKRTPRDIEWVAIHDAARPMLSQDVIDLTLAAAIEHGAAAAPALPIHLTVKRAVGPLPAPVRDTLDRRQLWAMQTPQIVRRQMLLDAYDHCPCPLEQITDDLQLLELTGQNVWLVAGDEKNIKITTLRDLILAEVMLRR